MKDATDASQELVAFSQPSVKVNLIQSKEHTCHGAYRWLQTHSEAN